jgi:hypothetical protein
VSDKQDHHKNMREYAFEGGRIQKGEGDMELKK